MNLHTLMKKGKQIASALHPEIATLMKSLQKEKLMLLSKFHHFHEMYSVGQKMVAYIKVHKLHQFAYSYDGASPHNCIFTQWNKYLTPEHY